MSVSNLTHDETNLEEEIYELDNNLGANCFNAGTKILCVNEVGAKVYIPVEQLKPGMLVDTYKNGPKPIEIIGKSTRVNEGFSATNLMYRMPRSDNMTGDLILTGGHSILIDRNDLSSEQKRYQITKYKVHFAVEDKRASLACVSDRFVKISDNKEYTRYNFAVSCIDPEKRHGVYANGVLCEIPSLRLIKTITFDTCDKK